MSEERRRGTWIARGEPRGEKVAGGLFSFGTSFAFGRDSDVFSCSSLRPAALRLPAIERGFLTSVDVLLPISFDDEYPLVSRS